MDLGTQILDYARAVDSAQEPMTLDEIMELRLGSDPVKPIGRPAHPADLRPRRPWLVAVVVAAAVLVLVGGAALLLPVIGSDGPVATTPSTVPPSSSPWSRVPHDESAFAGEGDQRMTSVTAGGPGLVAVGRDGSVGLGVAAVWTSVDGITWSRVPHDGEVFGGPSWLGMTSVTAGGPGLVAVGFDVSRVVRAGAVWTSVDGIAWSRVPHDLEVFGGAIMNSVTVGGPGLVAVGSINDGAAAAWTSPDGITWTRVNEEESFYGTEMLSVTAGGPGLVAVGFDGEVSFEDDTFADHGRGQVAAVWTSVDGTTWIRVPHDEAVFGGRRWVMSSVVAGGPGLVAVGYDDSSGLGEPPVWTSVDGITWSRVLVHDDMVFGGGEINSVTVGATGLVAVGQAVPNAAVWTSVDGVTWSRVRHDEAVFGGDGFQEMVSVTVSGSRLVAVGSHGSYTDTDAAVWVAAGQG